MNNWGTEGVNYKIINGKRVIPKDELAKRLSDVQYSKKTGIGVYSYPFPQRGDGVKDPTGQNYTTNTVENTIVNYNPDEKATLSAYGVELWKDLYPSADELPKSTWGEAWQLNFDPGSEFADILNRADDLMKNSIPQAVLCSPSDFDHVWGEMMKNLNALGIHRAEEEFTKIIKKREKL